MKNVFQKTFVVSFLTLSVCISTQAQSFEPGLWKSKESLNLNGIPMPQTEDQECITVGQAKDAKATIEKELKKHACQLTKWKLKNKKLEAAIKCNNEDMDAVGNLQGDFSEKSYNLKGEAKGTYKQILPAVAKLELTGQWLQKCAPDKKARK